MAFWAETYNSSPAPCSIFDDDSGIPCLEQGEKDKGGLFSYWVYGHDGSNSGFQVPP